ncbi:transposase, partial [Chlorogloea sp. CCALA 695]
MLLSERHVINPNHKNYKEIDNLAFLSKNLYNVANYIIRQEFINNHKYLKYNAIQKQLQNQIDYKALLSKVSQQILIILDKNWQGFFEATKSY